MRFNSLLPEFYITNFANSINFYQKILGFKVEYTRDNPKFAFLSYGDSQLMIQELKPGEKEKEALAFPFGRGTNFQIDTKSVKQIMDQLEKNHYPLERGIKDSWYEGSGISYGCREILVRDPDGYLLRFSEELGEKKAV